MNSSHYDSAAGLYAKKDWLGALQEYYACLKEDISSFDPGDIGLVYYRLGNCLLHNKNYPEAVEAYQKSLADAQFMHHTAVLVNLGRAQQSSGDLDGAIASYQQAVADPNYARAYRINIALGRAFQAKGDIASAGNAFRAAAFDPKNATPTAALRQLADCFNKFGRPQNAVRTYQTILKINEDPKVCGPVYADLGEAYTKIAHYEEAVQAFKSADQNHFELSASQKEAYRKSEDMLNNIAFATEHVDELRKAAIEETQAVAVAQGQADDLHPTSDVSGDAADSWASDLDRTVLPDQPTDSQNAKNGAHHDFQDNFDLNTVKPPKRRHIALRVILTVIIVIILVLAAGIFCYTQGIGFPSQQAQAETLFQDNASGKDVASLWADPTVANGEMQAVAKTSNVSVVSQSSDMDKSTVIMQANLSQGGVCYYQVGLVRFGIGYKVKSVQLYFPATATTNS
ncbi:MAG: tetratricopeptide repeat protein [Coriobacteriales bacterium]|nr:tetratricopeptide repeat protein [Coriobacteriales bacterium]